VPVVVLWAWPSEDDFPDSIHKIQYSDDMRQMS
jgi:hypothetical protein